METDVKECMFDAVTPDLEAQIDAAYAGATRVWLAGRFIDARTDPPPHEILGIYSTPEAAMKRCTDMLDFVMPLPLDRDLPEARYGQFVALPRLTGKALTATESR